jgi:hypothetical protein
MVLWTTSWPWNGPPCVDSAFIDHWMTWVQSIMCLINFYTNSCSTSQLYCNQAPVTNGVVDHQLMLRWSTIRWLCCCGPLVDLNMVHHTLTLLSWTTVDSNLVHISSTSTLVWGPPVDHTVVHYALTLLLWTTGQPWDDPPCIDSAIVDYQLALRLSTMHWLCCCGPPVNWDGPPCIDSAVVDNWLTHIVYHALTAPHFVFISISSSIFNLLFFPNLSSP